MSKPRIDQLTRRLEALEGLGAMRHAGEMVALFIDPVTGAEEARAGPREFTRRPGESEDDFIGRVTAACV